MGDTHSLLCGVVYHTQLITFQTTSNTFWNTLDQLFPFGWSPGKLDYIAWKMIKSCGLITVKWVLNWMSPNISSPPYFMDSLLFCKQNQNCKYFRYSWRPNYINNSCHWEFHKTTLSTVPDTCMSPNNSNLVLNVNCFQSSTSGTFAFWWAES